MCNVDKVGWSGIPVSNLIFPKCNAILMISTSEVIEIEFWKVGSPKNLLIQILI